MIEGAQRRFPTDLMSLCRYDYLFGNVSNFTHCRSCHVQETLSLSMCVLFITSPLLYVTVCPWLDMVSMVMSWPKVRGTAGWDPSDTTIQVIQDL